MRDARIVYAGVSVDVLPDFTDRCRVLRRQSGLRLVSGGNDADGPALYSFVKTHLGDEAASIVRQAPLCCSGYFAGEKIINVDHKGAVPPDQFWRGTASGNLLELPLAEIMSRPLFADLRRRETLLTGRCARCRYLSVCRGSHRERAFAAGGSTRGDEPSCYLTEEHISAESPPLVEAKR